MKKEDPNCSRGFGFVEFKTKEEVDAAIAGLNGSPLGHRHIMVQYAGQPTSGKLPQCCGRGEVGGGAEGYGRGSWGGGG